jgi:hypothetical protein
MMGLCRDGIARKLSAHPFTYSVKAKTVRNASKGFISVSNP